MKTEIKRAEDYHDYDDRDDATELLKASTDACIVASFIGDDGHSEMHGSLDDIAQLLAQLVCAFTDPTKRDHAKRIEALERNIRAGKMHQKRKQMIIEEARIK